MQTIGNPDRNEKGKWEEYKGYLKIPHEEEDE